MKIYASFPPKMDAAGWSNDITLVSTAFKRRSLALHCHNVMLFHDTVLINVFTSLSHFCDSKIQLWMLNDSIVFTSLAIKFKLFDAIG